MAACLSPSRPARQRSATWHALHCPQCTRGLSRSLLKAKIQCKGGIFGKYREETKIQVQLKRVATFVLGITIMPIQRRDRVLLRAGDSCQKLVVCHRVDSFVLALRMSLCVRVHVRVLVRVSVHESELAEN